MLVVKVELWPYGVEEAKEELGVATIANLGRDQNGFRYQAHIQEREDLGLGIRALDETLEIVGHDRRQSVWILIERVLHESVTLTLQAQGSPGRGASMNG
jgi:hypothetical protein